jgi:CRISPR-associated endonuclease/helicase Cas3
VTSASLSNKDRRADLERRMAAGVVLVDVRVGGLSRGLLDDDSDDAGDVSELAGSGDNPAVPFRVSRTNHQGDAAASPQRTWREETRIAIDHDQEGDESEWLVVETRADVPAESENGRSVTVGRAQVLDEHEMWAEEAAREIATRLGLPGPYVDMLALAARLHDEGKKAARWQRAFHAPPDGVYGKTRSRPDQHVLGGYRHELGSLPRAEGDSRVQRLDDDMRDLCLHLIAAHHGNARPSIRLDGAEEPPSKLEQRARDIALRFARLEKQWGPWGLAWWETLLRAADQQASRRNDLGGHDG